MKTKKILGLDIGTNSIGAALINLPNDFADYGKEGSIEWLGSRIIPMDGDYLQKFESGSQAETKAAFRRKKRGSRRLKHRYKLRRTRLIKVFKALGWIDEAFPIDKPREFKNEIKLKKYSFKISDWMSFSDETINEFKREMGIEGKKRKKNTKKEEVDFLLPNDWIVYFLRKKALTQKVEISELVRIIYLLNQRRGFKSSRKDLAGGNVLPYEEFIIRKNNKDYGEDGIETKFVSLTTVTEVKQLTTEPDKKGKFKFQIIVDDKRVDSEQYIIDRKEIPNWIGKTKELLITQKVDKKGKFTQLMPDEPGENEWALCTTALDEKINHYRTPGEYFFEELKKAHKENRNYKIRQYPVYRWRYQKELELIWQKQCELNPELNKINKDKSVLVKLAEILYPTQAKYKLEKLKEFESNDLLHIISKDIIYYQRELKSQKHSISECRYEKRKGIDGETYGLKCIPRSSPLFQEFRIWQDIHNIKILKHEEKVDGKTKLDIDQSSDYINESVKEKMFELFNFKASVSEREILEIIKECNQQNDIVLAKKGGTNSHRINLFANREILKGNETLARYRSVFKKADFNGDSILSDPEKLFRLWHIDYSITSSDQEKSKQGITTALTKLLPEHENKGKVIEAFTKLPELKKEYGSYSACAIKKLLPVMRCGKFWNEKDITEQTKSSAEKIEERLESIEHNIRRIGDIADDDVKKQVLKSFIGKTDFTKGLSTYQAGYLIYDRHSEKETKPVNSVEEFTKYIQKEIPNNSLRNPIVEQVVRETMFLVRDVWNQYGDIDEIHIELGRDLKNNADERKRIAESQKENFDEKQRIKKLLNELINDGFSQHVDNDETRPYNYTDGTFTWNTHVETNKRFEVNPNPESPIDIEKFRIWRNLSKQSEFEWTKKVSDEKIPTEQQIKKYALWLSQHCRSPYTGRIIPLSKLFDTNQYEIEHIIPRAKMKNDSFNNLVIAEWGVNKAKDNQLAANFIAESKGKCKYGDVEYKLFTYEEYDKYCNETFRFKKLKRKNLLATEPPDDFIERQLNDTRYISRKLSELLAPVAKNENGILFTGGMITSELKKNWGLNSVWKELIKPRFERLERINEGKTYIVNDIDEHGNPVFHFNVPENQQLDTKRIDHRHHALDALIIAATTREHIRYLNTLNAAETNEEHRKIRLAIINPISKKIRDFRQPWEGFTKQAKEELEKVVVSFKTNKKIISIPKNRTAYLKVENGKPKKEFKEQKANPKWMAVRKSMFKEPQGIIYLKEVYEESNILKAIKIQIDRMMVQDKPEMNTASYIYDKEARKVIRELIEKSNINIHDKTTLPNEIKNLLKKNPLKDLSGNVYNKIKIALFVEYAAKRVSLDKSFNHKKIDKIPYSKIGKSVLGKLLHEHLNAPEYNGKPELAFSNDGLDSLAKKAGRPVIKVTIAEKKDESAKFGKQYFEVDAGAMAYFIMYENQKTKERSGFQSIPIHKAIKRLTDKTKHGIADEKAEHNLLVLSPGDLVYVPTKLESEKIKQGEAIERAIDWSNKMHISDRIYQMRKSTKTSCYFLKSTIADLIIPYSEHDEENKKKYGEFGTQNLLEISIDDLSIKNVCIKLKVDRLGNIKPI